MNSVATVADFELAQRQARVFALSQLVPPDMRNHENCLAAIMLADEMGESRLAVLQNIYFVHGRPGWMASYMIARVNRSGKFKGPLRWKSTGTGDDLEVTCYADLAGVEGDARVEVPVSMATAKADGWTTFRDKNGVLKPNPKYVSMPEHMLRWRSATWLIRLYAPEVMMGLPTRDELEDMSEQEMVDVTPPRPPALSDFEPYRRDAEPNPADSPPAPPQADPPADEAAPGEAPHHEPQPALGI